MSAVAGIHRPIGWSENFSIEERAGFCPSASRRKRNQGESRENGIVVLARGRRGSCPNTSTSWQPASHLEESRRNTPRQSLVRESCETRPRACPIHAWDAASLFIQRCESLGVNNVPVHQSCRTKEQGHEQAEHRLNFHHAGVRVLQNGRWPVLLRE